MINSRMEYLFLTALSFLFMGTALQAVSEGKRTGTSNSAELITLNLNGVSLSNTLELLARKMGKNLMLDPNVDNDLLNMALSDITPQEALSAILEAHNLAYKELEGNVLYVANVDKIGVQMFIKNITCKYAKAADL